MTELQILTAIKNNEGIIGYTDLLGLNLTDPYRDASAYKARINKMIERGLLEGETRAYGSISITDSGRLYLQDKYYLEEQKQKLAEDGARDSAKKNRHDWRLAIGTALLAGLIGFALDLIAHFCLG